MPRPKSNGLPKEKEEQFRVHQLLDAASEVFLEAGYEAASTAEMARRAHSSKQTFYARFPSKQKLFLAVIDYQTLKVADQVSVLFKTDQAIRPLLLQVARELLGTLLSKEHVALARLVYMESPRFPEAARYLMERGPDRGIANLAQRLKQQTSMGVLTAEDALLAAQHFSGLVVGDLVHRALLGLKIPRSRTLLEARAESAVDAFLRIYAHV